MAEVVRFCLRVRYQKVGRLRYLSHLDMLRTLERSIRRAGLPFSVTQGFSPHMRCAYSAALPVAASSTYEYYDLSLSQYVPADEALARLQEATPADLAPLEAAYVDIHMPALDAWLNRMRWQLDLSGVVLDSELEAALATLAAEPELTYTRGKKLKRIDLTQTLIAAELEAAPSGVALTLDTLNGGAARLQPTVFADALLAKAGLAKDVPMTLQRLGQWHQEPDGTLVSAL